MKIWPFNRKAASSLTAADTRTSWWHTIVESFTGAWQRNVVVQRENVLAYWAVYACIRLIASDVAKMRVKLVEQGANGIWTEVKSSPYLKVLRKPNPYQTRLQFFSYWVTSLLIHGNAYALKQRDARGVVVALYLLDPCGVTPLVAEDGSVFYRLRRDNLSGRGELLDVTVPASEIIHDRGVCLYHPLVGVSPIFACGVAATQGLAIQNTSAAFFANGAMPGGIIKVPGAMDEAKAQEVKAKWESKYGGENRGKVALLADKMEYQPLTVSAHDSQVVEQLKMTAQVVCSTFNVPPYKVGVADPPANTTVAALNQQYYDQCLQIIIEGIEASLDEGLGLPYVEGRTLGSEFDLHDLIRMDPLAQMDYVEKGVKCAVLKPNEGRALFDLQPVDGGDTPYLQQQNYSLSALARRDDAAAAPASPPIGANTPPPAPTADDTAEALDKAFEHAAKVVSLLRLPPPVVELKKAA